MKNIEFAVHEGFRVYLVGENSPSEADLLFGEVAVIISDDARGLLVELLDGRRGYVVGLDSEHL